MEKCPISYIIIQVKHDNNNDTVKQDSFQDTLHRSSEPYGSSGSVPVAPAEPSGSRAFGSFPDLAPARERACLSSL